MALSASLQRQHFLLSLRIGGGYPWMTHFPILRPPAALEIHKSNKFFSKTAIYLLVAIIARMAALSLIFYINRRIMIGLLVDDFPLYKKINPIFVSACQFLVSSIVLKFSTSNFSVSDLITSSSVVSLTAFHYAASIVSSLGILYFNQPPDYFQLRSFSISYAFFYSFFSSKDQSFADASLAIVIIICGTLLASEPQSEFYLPFLIFGISSSIASVHFSFLMRKSLEQIKCSASCMALSVNVAALAITAPIAIAFTDFSVFTDHSFRKLEFVIDIIASGILSAVISFTTCIIERFTTPLLVIAISTARQSLFILVSSFIHPQDDFVSPLSVLGHLMCISGTAMMTFLQLKAVADAEKSSDGTNPYLFKSI